MATRLSHLLPLSHSDSSQEGLFRQSHFSNSETPPGQNVRILCFCPWFLACPAPRNHRDAHWGGGLLFSTHLKVWFFGSGRGLILVHGLHRWSVFLLYVWHAQDVSLWRMNAGAVSWILPRCIKPIMYILHWSLQKHFCQENPSITSGPEITFPRVSV